MPFHLDHSSPEIMSLLLYRYFCKLVKIWPLQWTFLEVMHDIFRSLYVFFNAWVWNLSKDTWWFSFSVWLSTNWFYVWSFGRVGVYVAALLLFIVKCNQKCCWSVILMSHVFVVVTIVWLWHRRSRVEARYDAKRAGRSRCFPFKKKSLAPAFCSFHRKKALEKVGIRHSLCRTECMQTIWGITQHLILRNQVSPWYMHMRLNAKFSLVLK